ncbi:DUF6507 family protein [Nocardiopsis dassonvillei]|uniref:DUF6507 family protein n=1 Tax=Nocardiopsis dassonvillei TaxID=2014 RepID=UPI0020A3C863|nr:DUF6507 family protein [Nocardiopsis dassonvillei]MCP3014991.1 DUF6507 family protein [Nocardiopsis dassonvillei]
MSQWNIQPAAVGGVLTAVAGHLGEEGGGDGLIGVMQKVEEHLVDSGDYAKSPVIGMALGEFAEHYFAIMSEMAGLTVSAVSGASEATTHYVEGDLDMAAESQASAGTIPEPEPEPAPTGGRHQAV